MTRRRRTRSRAFSLRAELATLGSALHAARIVSSAIAHLALETEHDRRQAPEAVVAVLELVGLRLRALDAVLAGDLDPERMIAAHNAVDAAGRVEDDIVLPTRKRGAR